MLVSKVTK